MKKSSIFCLFSWGGGKKEKDIYILKNTMILLALSLVSLLSFFVILSMHGTGIRVCL